MRTKSVFFALLLAAGSLACGDPGYTEYKNSDLQLVTSYAAKEYCSCIFVMNQSEAWCNAWTKASPQVTTIHLNRPSKSVDTVAGMMWGAKAHYVDESFGCVLE